MPETLWACTEILLDPLLWEHTHTHTYTHSHGVSQTFTHTQVYHYTHTHIPIPTHSLTLAHALTHMLTRSHWYTFTHITRTHSHPALPDTVLHCTELLRQGKNLLGAWEHPPEGILKYKLVSVVLPGKRQRILKEDQGDFHDWTIYSSMRNLEEEFSTQNASLIISSLFCFVDMLAT